MKRILVLFILWSLELNADDGMWLPHQIADLDLPERGMQLEPGDLFRTDSAGLVNAIVKLNGATGSFISNDGLILTNHHVAFRAIQRASDAEHDYLKNGFIANDFTDEIQAFGQTANILLGYDDVTDQVMAAIKDNMTFREKYDALDRIKKKLVKKAEKAGPDIRAEIKSIYSGKHYYLYRYKRLQDVRIVFAPPEDLGRFGGEIDNWMWPRHTCDFTFLRAYVSKDGVGKPYSPDNVPYHPESFLKISLDGVDEGDFTFVMGYPGRTYRNYTVKEVEQSIAYMQQRLSLYKEITNFYENRCSTSRDIQIKYAGKIRGLANSHKNYTGKLQGFASIDLLHKKQQQENAFLQWARSEASTDYAKALQDYHNFLDNYEKIQDRQRQLEQVVSRYTAPMLLSQAHTIYRTVYEKEKPDAERETGFQERDFDDIRQAVLLADRSYDIETDKAYFKFMLGSMVKSDPSVVPHAFRDILATQSEQKIVDFVDDLYQCTILQSGEKRAELLEYDLKKLHKIHDPLIELAASLEEQLADLREQEKALNQQKSELKRNVLQGMLEFTNGRIAPDANSTLRLTFGNVAGYSPRDGVDYRAVTTLTGVFEKETGEFPFIVPDKIKLLYETKDFGQYVDPEAQDVVTCFLNATNVTGGNSGSPTLNAKGEVIGIIFDMTYESVVGDYYIIPDLQRTISVDIRYILFVVEKFGGATWLIEKLGL
ncbi:S46 family peptidase [candidate division KSB1 bacterium]|nr:S46 family peptidase [candidate division KSB1 bacterium]